MVTVIERERLLCFEYLCNGDLQMHLTDESCGFDWHTRYQTIKGICQGLHCLHDGGIAHLDLKPDNILFDEKMVPKLLDYGLSRVFSEERRRTVLKNVHGSLAYMATPEYMAGGEITLMSDIYCLGVIIMQIVTGQNKNNYSNTASIVESWRSMLELDASKGGHTLETCYQQLQVCVEIGMCCIDHDPGNRPITQYIIDKLDNKEMERSIRSDTSTLSLEQICMYIGAVAFTLSDMIFPSKGTLLPSGEELKPSPAPPALLKIVLKLEFNSKNCKSSILKTVAMIEGTNTLAYDEHRNTLTVVGNVDVIEVVTMLRKRKHPVQVVMVSSTNNVSDQESDSCTIM